MNILLTSVFVDDPLQAFRFYTEVLGFVERVYMPEALLAIVASPDQPDGTGLLLEPNSNPIAKSYQEGVYQMGMPVIVFGTADIHKEYARLKDLGVVFRKEPTVTDFGIDALFEDTFGNLIQLVQQG
jgi:predicted enzyme related to lactoylglutathione lyase